MEGYKVGIICWSAIFALVTLIISEVDLVLAHSCLPKSSCDATQCEIPKDCPGGLTMDVCDCCKVCARVENQSCGGEYGLLGKCDRGLQCVISPKVGKPITGYEEGICQVKPCVEKNTYFGCNILDFECICTEELDCEDPHFAFNSRDLCEEELDVESEERPDCSKAKCEIVFQPECPSGSTLVLSSVTPGQCCPQPGICACNPQGCPELSCPSGLEKVLKYQKTGQPGHCCDLYECVPKGLDCDDVECPSEECPEDSYPLPGLASTTNCCPIPQGCACLPRLCEQIQCPVGLRVKLINAGTGKPGACCSEFKCVNATDQTCYFEDKQHANGESWQMDKCTSCSCRDGLTFCHAVGCKHEQFCGRMAIPPGECCAVCIGCVSSTGELYNNSDIWKEDDCTSCRCDDGFVHCHAEMCSVNCENPRKVAGQCCFICDEATVVTLPPHCQNLENCSLPCEFGLRRNREGCYVCQCKPENCSLECEYGYQIDDDDHEICHCALPPSACPFMEGCKKHCSYGFKKTKDGCEQCKCKKCKDLDCSKNCQYGYRKNDKGCHICKCSDGPFSSSNATSYLTTTMMTITEATLDRTPSRKGPPCATMDKRTYEDGETWYDGCRECYCHNGREMCALITCPTPNCASPVIKTGDCCPKCIDEPLKPVMLVNSTICQSVDGQYYVEGETWNLDTCTHCTCHHGRVLCDGQECPPLLCHHPVREERGCCPKCLEPPLPTSDLNIPEKTCIQNGHHYESGETWKPNICQSCLCYHGKIQCYTETCPKLTCEKPVLRKGHCCPMCLESRPSAVCLFKGVFYSKGEHWNVDECTDCVCMAGQQQCTKKVCSISCDNPFKIAGQCCPLCKEPKIPKNFTTKYPSGPAPGSGGSSHPEGDSRQVNPQLPVIILIIFIIFIIILIGIIGGLLIYICRRRNQISLRDLEKTPPQPLLQPRPKSTNLEFQGIFPDHKPSCNHNYNEKNNCDHCDYKKIPDYPFKNISF